MFYSLFFFDSILSNGQGEMTKYNMGLEVLVVLCECNNGSMT